MLAELVRCTTQSIRVMMHLPSQDCPYFTTSCENSTMLIILTRIISLEWDIAGFNLEGLPQ